MNIQEVIKEAIADVATEVRSGVPVAAAILNVAVDYDLKIEVLTARFERAFPDGVTAAAPSLGDFIKSQVEEACARYRVPVSAVRVMFTKRGEKITAVCRSGNDVIGVRHSDGSTMRYYPAAFDDASMTLTMKAWAA